MAVETALCLTPNPICKAGIVFGAYEILQFRRDLVCRLLVGKHDHNVLGHYGVIFGRVSAVGKLELYGPLKLLHVRAFDVDVAEARHDGNELL